MEAGRVMEYVTLPPIEESEHDERVENPGSLLIATSARETPVAASCSDCTEIPTATAVECVASSIELNPNVYIPMMTYTPEITVILEVPIRFVPFLIPQATYFHDGSIARKQSLDYFKYGETDFLEYFKRFSLCGWFVRIDRNSCGAHLFFRFVDDDIF